MLWLYHSTLKTTNPSRYIWRPPDVGGIHANNIYPAEFISDNLKIQCNVIQCSTQKDVQKLLFFCSSCIYPKLATQPIVEEALMTDALEPTNEPNVVAQIVSIKMCESFNHQVWMRLPLGHADLSMLKTMLTYCYDPFILFLER